MPAADADTHAPSGRARPGSSPRLYERVFGILADQIERGSLPPNESLTETAVALRFGISRAPARRALEELEQAGLVVRAEPHGFVPRRQGVRAAAPASSAPAPGDSERLVQQPSWEPIYAEVESEIIARISFASWRVNEAELARHYAVSRTVSRDVIGRLQQRGVIQKDERSRWCAPALSPGHVGELYELRWLLEPVALAKAAPLLPDGMLAGVRGRLVEAMDDRASVDGDTLDALERDLHVDVLGHCGSGALMHAIAQPQSLLIAHRFLYRWTARMFDREPFLPEHLDIVDRLAAGHVDEAGRALEAHLKVSRDRALSRIGVIASGTQPDPLSYLDRLPG
jgi:DNA-binding GntR family transcriptional regulator